MREQRKGEDAKAEVSELSHHADERFLEYYREKSQSAETISRTGAMYDVLCRVRSQLGSTTKNLSVADIGCGPGAQSIFWAAQGHDVHGLDVNAEFIEVAAQRAASNGLSIDFRVGSATQLPWPDESVEICLAPELLEHVSEWRDCLDEFARILKPGGVLYINTSNKLCPIQNEFNLPLYSWYPRPVKKYCEKLAVTTRPQFANYATYPAVNWFSYFELRREFRDRGMDSLDRADLIHIKAESGLRRGVTSAVRALSPLRFLLQLITPYTLIVGVKS